MTAALRAARPADLPTASMVRGVAFVPQGDDLCGPATLSMLLSSAGLNADLASLTAEVYLPGRRGTLQSEMLAGARRHGGLAVELPKGLADAFRELADGTPVGVLLNLGLSWWPRWHYAVLVGYDLNEGIVWLHSGATAMARWSLVTFEYTWARSGYWSFVAIAPNRLPRTADPSAVTVALLGLDRVLPPSQVTLPWSLATRRWPNDLTLALGAANNLMAAGRLEQAAQDFQHVADQHDSAVAWNNLAQARMRLGDQAAARTAATRAVQRARQSEPRWLDEALKTLAEVEP